MTCRLWWLNLWKWKPDVEFQYGGRLGEFNGMSFQSHVSHCRVLPLGEFTVTIPEPHATLQGAVTWRNQCRDRATLLAIAKFVYYVLCLPCAALSWGQPKWQGLGFSGLVHEETHPCASNFIQSIFETVQAGCINSVLVQTVLSVNDSIWEKYFLISVLSLGLQIFLLWPRKPLLLPLNVNKTLMSIWL